MQDRESVINFAYSTILEELESLPNWRLIILSKCITQELENRLDKETGTINEPNKP